MRLLRSAIAGCLALVLAGVTAASADTPVNVVYSFDIGVGNGPFSELALEGSTLYGTTQAANGNQATIFAFPVGGSSVTTLHTFSGGAEAYAGVTPVGSTLYGATYIGGFAYSLGTDGSNFTDLQSLGGSIATDTPLTLVGQTLYGTTATGGSHNTGTIFSIGTNPASFNTVTSFPSGVNGASSDGPTALAAMGNTFYGGTSGPGSVGSVFSVGTDGTDYTTLYSFGNGATVQAISLVGSTLYGIASGGSGAPAAGEIFSMNLDGTNFTDVHTFSGADGLAGGLSTLTLVGSTLYGTTNIGGADSDGTIFSVNTVNDTFTLLHSFTQSTTDGGNPQGLTLVGSTLYGAATRGGANNEGVIFTFPTPEPASIALLLAGLPVLVALMYYRTKRRRKVAVSKGSGTMAVVAGFNH